MRITTARLEAQMVSVQRALSAHEQSIIPNSEWIARLDHLRDAMIVELRAHIYGHRHKPIRTSATRTIVTTQPSSWWQAFKLSAIESGNPFFAAEKIKYAMTGHRLDVTASATPFTAFPDLPYPVQKAWGAPVEILIEDPISVRLTEFQ